MLIGFAVRADFRRLYTCQRQDAHVLPKRRQSHQGDKLCDVSTVPLVARWPVSDNLVSMQWLNNSGFYMYFPLVMGPIRSSKKSSPWESINIIYTALHAVISAMELFNHTGNHCPILQCHFRSLSVKRKRRSGESRARSVSLSNQAPIHFWVERMHIYMWKCLAQWHRGMHTEATETRPWKFWV